MLDFVNLKDVMHTQIGRYSKGMRQRVKIAHALVNDPDLIVLDEPLTGCDPGTDHHHERGQGAWPNGPHGLGQQPHLRRD